MTFEICPDCVGLIADILQALLVGLLLGAPFSILLVARNERAPRPRIQASRKDSDILRFFFLRRGS